MSIKTRSAMKALFEDGDKPSSADHDDWVDSVKRFDSVEHKTIYVKGIVTGDKYLLFVAPRDVTLTRLNTFSQDTPEIGTYDLYYNRSGTVTKILDQFSTGGSDHPTVSTPPTSLTTINTSLKEGDLLYLDATSIPSTPSRVSITIWYK